MGEDTANRNWSWYDQTYDRAYKRGYEDGATKNKKEALWNIGAAKPKNQQDVRVIVCPFNWKTRRIAKKNKIDFVILEGFYIDGGTATEYMDDGAGVVMTVPDVVCVFLGRKPNYVLWSEVRYWQSMKLPEEIEDEIIGGQM